MKYETATVLLAISGLTAAAPAPRNVFDIPRYTLRTREVPQEHSHNKFLAGVNELLKIDNPAGIQDAVFGLLGDKAAAEGAGTITNLACLHQATADQAFTNAKAAADIAGMADALNYAALERNTGSVGLVSAACTDDAVNPEIQAVQQHQDPAATDAAAINKAITLSLATQLASIGADPQLALQSGTFAPGELGDNTGAGNTCDTVDDVEGCIFSQNLLVEDASAADITAAVAGIAVAGSAAAVNATVAACPTAAANASAVAAPAAESAAVFADAEAAIEATPVAAAGTNVQAFSGTLGGVAPPVISSAGDRPFAVNGATFVNAAAALQRSCAVQNNACSNAVNSGAAEGSVSDCKAQEDACNVSVAAKKTRRAALDLGTCGSPAVQFAVGLDGRKEASFQAVNQDDFNHGSALKIGVIAQFICSQLASSCKAGADAIAACDAATTAAGAVSGQASADAFNAAFGV